MEIYSSDDDSDRLSERFESYSLSADVSESESSTSGLSGRQFACTSNSIASSSSSPRRPRPSLGETSVPSARMNVNLPGLGLRNVVVPRAEKKPESEMSEVELMKERFAKLLLGEDMSGGRKGVCTALAISNAITNLSASVFGELWKLEPLTPQKKSTWRREMDWLLCVSDSIVELTPSVQEFPGGGGALEVMVPRPRSDLHVNLPALKKLDAMLQGILDGFRASEFHYVDHGLLVTGDSPRFPSSVRQEEKWWLPFPKVPQNGLSDEARKRLQQCRECSNQILKAAMAINGNVLAEMDIPNIYLRGLPKSGKACLGEVMHRYMTADKFSPECLLDDLDLSSEFTTLEIANRIEAAVHIWKQKYTKRRLVMSKSGKASWGGKVKGLAGDVEKSKLLAYRAETLLQNLKMRFPGLSQTALDMSKIQFNKDVGHAILESYSRVMEGLAFNIMARIDDLLYIDDATKRRAASESMCLYESTRYGGSLPRQKRLIPNGSFLAQQQQSFHGSSSRKPRPLHHHNRSCGSGIARERTEHSVRIRSSSSDTDDDNKSDKVSD